VSNPSSAASPCVLIFLRGLATPVVLYTETPPLLYDEIKRIIQTADARAPKLIEKPGLGPLKKVSFLDTELTGVALQGEIPFSTR